ncbi:MAG: Carboxypeptidase regulatory-like domain [Armatimonadetes bacterium]|nr:Carboxypeptidase regulatory-like domain [Armatimonadota bacterium]
MNSTRPIRVSLILPALGVFVPLALLVAAGAGAKDDPEGSVLPQPAGAPGPETPTVAVPAVDFRLLTLRAGEGPYPWSIPGRIVRSFVTDDPNSLEIVASAGVKGRPELDAQVEWDVLPPAGFQVPDGATLRGPKLVVRLQRPDGNLNGMGEPLSFTVRARVAAEGRTHVRTLTVQQDPRDRLRQEYVDLERAYVPARSELLDEEQFKRAYGKKHPRVTFAELNWSRIPGREDRYPVILAAEELVRALSAAEVAYGRELQVSSGFRNPVRQVEVHGSVAESHHQYGRAADLYVAPDSAQPKTGRNYASEGDWLRLAAATMRGGGGWVEPMLACHVNTDGCHVHVDVREQGTRSQVVQISGKITDPTGLPVPGATVRLAGMPATTNAWGLFTLKHVLTPKEYDLSIEAPGRGLRTQKVSVASPMTTLALRMPTDPNPALIARVESSQPGPDGKLLVRLAVRNSGSTPALGLRLAAGPMNLPSRGTVTPAQLAVVGPGQETAVTLQLAGRANSNGGDQFGDGMPVVLSASYRNHQGEARGQALRLNVPLPAPAEPESPAASPDASTVPAAPRRRVVQGEGSAALGGLAIGGAAAAAAALARRRKRPAAPPAGEASVDPAQSTSPEK